MRLHGAFLRGRDDRILRRAEGVHSVALNRDMPGFIADLFGQRELRRFIRRRGDALGAGLHDQAIDLGVGDEQLSHRVALGDCIACMLRVHKRYLRWLGTPQLVAGR